MEFNMDDFKSISLKGRVCFAISCFENVLLYTQQDTSNWNDVLNYMWSFTSIEFLDDWNEIMSEILPENLLEFKIYEQHEYTHISKETFKRLYKLYIELDTRIKQIFDMIFYLGISHAYSSIVEYGERSFNEVVHIVVFMQDNNFPLPEIEIFKKYNINENKGWGNRFSSIYLSKIIKN